MTVGYSIRVTPLARVDGLNYIVSLGGLAPTRTTHDDQPSAGLHSTNFHLARAASQFLLEGSVLPLK